MTCIWGLLDSNPGRYQITRFIQSFLVKADITPTNSQRQLLSASLTTHSVLITKLDATHTVQAELLPSSNKPQPTKTNKSHTRVQRQWNVENQSADNELPTGTCLNT